jgi:hypothetical protein
MLTGMPAKRPLLIGAAIGASFFVLAVWSAAPDRSPRMLLAGAALGAVAGAMSGAGVGRR